MQPIRQCFTVLVVVCFSIQFAAIYGVQAGNDWPQWRGPNRNGILNDSQPLANNWPEKGLAKLWDSEPIPSDEDGGHGSVVSGRRAR